MLDGERRAELVSSLGALRARIADACVAVGRDARAVTLIAVTKTHPAADVATLAALGVLDIGESRDQEASAKLAEVAELRRRAAAGDPIPDLRWHFVGRLQSRKSRSVAAYAHAVHSLDRPELVEQLAAGVTRAGRDRLDVFIQVSLDGDPARGGVLDHDVESLADTVAAQAELRLRGVMAVAPMGADPHAAFAGLAEISARLRAVHPQAGAISAGMSVDLEAAIKNGSTHVRVGSALLGRRSQVFS
ncbi:MAG: YggS family pyridoxal phosphate-dependent enzyme [Pseudonocardiales bacterium]|nr:MAG: YggS family pyridoxal phosphate-dependent enzyme [Pseudonocardiales bacterium]